MHQRELKSQPLSAPLAISTCRAQAAAGARPAASAASSLPHRSADMWSLLCTQQALKNRWRNVKAHSQTSDVLLECACADAQRNASQEGFTAHSSGSLLSDCTPMDFQRLLGHAAALFLRPAQERLGTAPVRLGAWLTPRGEVAREPVHTPIAAMHLQVLAGRFPTRVCRNA